MRFVRVDGARHGNFLGQLSLGSADLPLVVAISQKKKVRPAARTFARCVWPFGRPHVRTGFLFLWRLASMQRFSVLLCALAPLLPGRLR